MLAEACRLLGDMPIQVKAYGDPEAYPEYVGRVAQAAEGTCLQLMGRLAREEVPAALAETDLLVVPSLWYENSPMVIAEAFAAGVPVAASDLGALPEQVQSGGLLIPPGDAQALAETLRRVALEPGLLDRLRDNVRRQVRASRSQHIDEMEAIYQALAGERGSPRLQ